MKKLYFLLFSILISSLSFGQIVINEVDSDQTGTDAAEFIELKWTANTALDGYVVVLFNGSADTSYAAYDLDGYTTDANGFFILGNTALSPDFVFADNFLQNGADAVAVYQANDTDFPNATAVTTTNLVDAIVYDTADADDTGLLTGLNETTQYNESENGLSAEQSLQRQNDGTYATLSPTLRAENNIPSAAIQVANLAALRADVIANGAGSEYEIMSIPIVTYTRANRNQKYVQDATAGILIDDNSGTITPVFSIGDGISGLIGTASLFNGILQLVPTQDASVTAGTPVTPEVVTIANILANVENYESELVKINGVTFADAGGIFATAADYSISDGSVTNFRTNFSEADYIGQTIPSGSNDIVVLVGEFTGTPQVTARLLSELTLSTKYNQIQGFAMYPNPTSLGYVTIASKSNAKMSVAVFDMLGKQVLNKTVMNNKLDVASLTSGIYIMKVSQDNAISTTKLVID